MDLEFTRRSYRIIFFPEEWLYDLFDDKIINFIGNYLSRNFFPNILFLQDSFVHKFLITKCKHRLIHLRYSWLLKKIAQKARKILLAAIQLHLTRVKLLLAGLIEGFIACLRSLCIRQDSF